MNKIGSALGVITVAVVLPFLLLTNAFSQPLPLTAKELIEKSALRDHLEALKKGEIVMMAQPVREMANQLNVLMAILVPASMQKTIDILQRQATAQEGPGILAIAEINTASASNLDEAFIGVNFTSDEKDEVRKMMEAAPGKRFNYSLDEFAMIKKRAHEVTGGDAKNTLSIHAMSLAMRDVLKSRFLSYKAHGIEGLAPYQEGPSKQIQPSQELISATESLLLLKERFPYYFECLRYYPKKQQAKLSHQFFWAKQLESGRPLFMLKHWVLDFDPNYAIITERRFYMNHSLNSLQVLICCLPHRDNTLVVLLNQAFTEKVNMAIGKSIAKRIGYNEVEKNIRPIFENLRIALQI